MSRVTIKMNSRLRRALGAWGLWYSRRLDRIRDGSKEDYTGYEQDLFEAMGCRGAPGPSHEMRKRLAETKKRKKAPPPALPYPKMVGDREKALRKESKRERRAEIRRKVFERATVVRGAVGGDWPRCEGPALHDPALGVQGARCMAEATDLSHLFGRGKGRLPESHRTCAAWCRDCHKSFGANRPSAAAWWAFIAQWLRDRGFLLEAGEAEKRAVFVEVRAALPSSPRTTRTDTNG